MLLNRMVGAVRRQDWFTASIELGIVILGLLIGLSLNNWVQSLDEEGLRQSYYERLIADLDTDKQIGGRAIAQAETIAARGARLYLGLQGEPLDKWSDGELVQAIVTSGYAYYPSVNRQTYDELISTGNLRLLTDTDLKRALSTYYDRWQDARQWDDLVRHEQLNYRDAIRGLLTPEQMVWVRQNIYELSSDPPPLDRPRLSQRLTDRGPAIAHALAGLAAEQERFRDQGRQIIEEASEVQTAIRARLPR